MQETLDIAYNELDFFWFAYLNISKAQHAGCSEHDLQKNVTVVQVKQTKAAFMPQVSIYNVLSWKTRKVQSWKISLLDAFSG